MITSGEAVLSSRAARVALIGLLALSVGLMACNRGGGGGGSSSGAINVKGSEYKFDPNTITLDAGKSATITLENVGTTSHDLEIEGVPGAMIKETQPKQKNSVTFTAPAAGTYKFLCTLPGHAEAGMTGTVTVK